MLAKKSQTDMLFKFIEFGFIFLVSMFIVGIHTNLDKTLLDPGDLTFYTLSHRFLYSPNCFVYVNKITKVSEPGTFDMERFTQENMNKCANNNNINLGAKLELFSADKKPEPLFFNKDLMLEYEAIGPISKDIEFVKKDFFILVREKNEIKPYNLRISVGWLK